MKIGTGGEISAVVGDSPEKSQDKTIEAEQLSVNNKMLNFVS